MITSIAEFDSAWSHESNLTRKMLSPLTDASLTVEDEMYGEKWTRAFTLMVPIHHQIHHRGRMTVLMRQAGLAVPGIYGPSREEWATFGMQPPEV